jgi:capsular exopolysaccharide synthesis family protein
MSLPSDPQPADSFDSAPNGGPGILQRALWRRKELLFLGCVIGLVAGAVYFTQQASVYQSSAKLRLKSDLAKPPLAAGAVDTWPVIDTASQQEEVMKGDIVLGNAATALAAKPPPSLEGLSQPEIVGVLRGGFSATHQVKDGTTNNILHLSYRGPNPDDCKTILVAIMKSYDAFLHGTHKEQTENYVKEVISIVKKLEARMEEANAKWQAWLESKKGKTKPVKVEEAFLSSLRQQLSAAKIRRNTLQGQIQQLEDAIKNGQALQIYDMVRAADRLPKGNSRLDDKLFDLQMQLDGLEVEFGEDHPQIKLIKRQMERIRERYYGTNSKEKTPPASKDDPAVWYLNSLKRDLAATQANQEGIEKQLAAAEAQAAEWEQWNKEEARFKEAADDARQSFKQVDELRDKIQLTQNFGGVSAEPIDLPKSGVKIAPVPAKIFIVAFLLGLLLGAALACIAEAMDQNFHTLDEIRERLGLAVVGHIPVVTPPAPVPGTAAGPLEPILCTYYQPKSVQAESFRGIRTALYFSLRSGDYKVIQITSPEARDGKTTLAANLAVSIAQSGKKVVVLDADFRKPRMHEIFGISADAGLASVIAGTTPLKDAVKATTVEGLSVLPCGPRPANPAELLTSPAFEQLLADLRAEYDFVLIDTPPLLAVSDPSAVAARVDGVLLVVRFSKNARPTARRAKEVLESMRADVVGVVVNGYGRNGSGYGYDVYRYGYGNAYGYGSDSAGYYHEDDKTPRAQNGTAHRTGILARLLRWLR